MNAPFSRLIAVLLLSAAPAAAEWCPPDTDVDHCLPHLRSMRGLLGSVDLTPGYAESTDPQVPERNLGEGHRSALMACVRPSGGAAQALAGRMFRVLRDVDDLFVRRVPPAEWSRRITAACERLQAAHPAREGYTADRWESAIDEMTAGIVSSFGDPVTAYYDEEATRLVDAEAQVRYAGIGILFARVDEGARIEAVVPRGPAAGAGLRSGDVITAAGEAEGEVRELAGLSQTEIMRAIRGVPGTRVRIRVRRLGRLSVERREVDAPRVTGRMIGRDVAYVHFSQFVAGVEPRVFERIDALREQGATRLILDLRRNLGGLVSAANAIAAAFLSPGAEIVEMRRRGEMVRRSVVDQPGRYAEGLPMVVLIDGMSASASEILAGALRGNGRATLVGSRSFGKNSFQDVSYVREIEDLESAVSVHVTNGEWFTPDGRTVRQQVDPWTGRPIEGSAGLPPDHPVETTQEQEDEIAQGLMRQVYEAGAPAADDPALQRAVEVVRALP